MGAIKIKGSTSGSTTITAPATGSDETIELSTALASKLPYSFGTATPSTTDSGFLWYDSNSTPAAPKFWDGAAFQNLAPAGGLTLISSESFSAVSSISVNNCFSATYRNYKLLVNIAASTGGIHKLRMRVGGADETGSVYFWSRIYTSTSSSTVAGASADSEFDLYYGDTSTAGQIEVMSPFSTSTNTHIYTRGGNADNDVSTGGGNTNATTSYDGFTMTPTSGTITGTVKIYGYKD